MKNKLDTFHPSAPEKQETHSSPGEKGNQAQMRPKWFASAYQAVRDSGLFISLIIICIYFSFTAPNFLSFENVWVTLRAVAPVGIISVGMTMVIIAGEIDLGVGSIGGFAGTLVAFLAITAHWPLPLAIIAALLMGAVTGGIAGAARVWFQVPTFVTTLAYLIAFQGAGFLITGGFPISPFPDAYSVLGAGTLGGIPVSGIMMLGIFLLGYILTRHTQFGRWLFAVGGNAEAARLVGIKVGAVRIAVMVITGVLAAFAGIVVSSLLSAGDPNVGTSWVFDVIAAVIIGGTSLSGGKGSVLRTLAGVLFIGALSDGMILLNVSQYMQDVMRGAIILFAVLLGLIQAQQRRGQRYLSK